MFNWLKFSSDNVVNVNDLSKMNEVVKDELEKKKEEIKPKIQEIPKPQPISDNSKEVINEVIPSGKRDDFESKANELFFDNPNAQEAFLADLKEKYVHFLSKKVIAAKKEVKDILDEKVGTENSEQKAEECIWWTVEKTLPKEIQSLLSEEEKRKIKKINDEFGSNFLTRPAVVLNVADDTFLGRFLDNPVKKMFWPSKLNIKRWDIYKSAGFNYKISYSIANALKQDAFKNIILKYLDSKIISPDDLIRKIAAGLYSKDINDNFEDLIRKRYVQGEKQPLEELVTLFKELGGMSVDEFKKKLDLAKQEIDTLLDAKYDGLVRFSSKAEKDVINIIREVGLQCVPSRLMIPAPKDYTGEEKNFIIDFMLYCPVLIEANGKFEVKPKVIFIGEYYGLYDEKTNYERSKNYTQKTDNKIPTEKFIAQSIGADTISIFPPPDETNVFKALNSANIIFDSDQCIAREKIKNNESLINQADEISGVDDSNIKIISYLEVQRAHVKAHYFSELVKNAQNSDNSYFYTLEGFKDTNTLNRARQLANQHLLENSEKKAYVEREKILRDLVDNPIENLNFPTLFKYVKAEILNFNKETPMSFEAYQEQENKSRNKTSMNTILLLRSLVRLAQISEEIEEQFPEQSGELDGFIEQAESVAPVEEEPSIFEEPSEPMSGDLDFDIPIEVLKDFAAEELDKMIESGEINLNAENLNFEEVAKQITNKILSEDLDELKKRSEIGGTAELRGEFPPIGTPIA